MKLELDPDSPVPIYHQIADAIRRKIRSGELQPGARLAPLRDAAEQWGVNLHTVRHAYAELAREGLVESRRAAGTHITARPASPSSTPSAAELQGFVSDVIHEAESRFGISAADLAAAIEKRPGTRRDYPSVSVVECSDTQCRDLAEQLRRRWAVDASPWSLERDEPLPDGNVVATYFHYNEIRRRWPRRLPEIQFVSIHPDPALADRLRAEIEERPIMLTLCELDEPTLQAVAADLSMTLPPSEFSLQTRLLDAPEQALEQPGTEPLLLAPRVWGRLAPEDRRSARLLQVRYVFAGPELDELGPTLGWRPAEANP